MQIEDIYNYRKVSDQIATGGQPSAAQLEAAAQAGFNAVINLATFDPGHSLPDEAGLVESLGMRYIAIPVKWNDPQESDFLAFEQAMGGLAGQKVLIHCAANFRATAFYALYAERNLGWSQAQGEALRETVWQGSNYPIWEQFIRSIRARSG